MDTTTAEIDNLLRTATVAAAEALEATDEQRAEWLEAIAEGLEDSAPELVRLAVSESHLSTARLTGELARTTAQLRLFAAVIREGSYLEATIDHPNPHGTPPSPDLRRMLIPLGPVAVFAASNFPFAFSVAGGDTASALAVGNPVIVKAHPGHPRLSARTADVVAEALTDVGAPPGIFALISGHDAGIALVQHPATAAVGFTGSVTGGRALFDLAAARPEPIPFYGELGSINPVVVTRVAATTRGRELATGLADSFTLGSGQFCTKPGLVFVPRDAGFEAELSKVVPVDNASTLLTPSIRAAYSRGLAALMADDAVLVIAGDASQSAADGLARPVALGTTTEALLANPEVLLEECFGPVTLVVSYVDDEDLYRAIAAVPGSLTATVHAEESEDLRELAVALRTRAGRLLFGGWPTGVAVNWAQHHGGPYPSTTSVFTSVGATAVRRFLRPVAYQTAPESVLPAALRDSNPLGIPRRIDGVLETQ